MTEHERQQEREALDLVLMGVEAGLPRLPDESVWRPCLTEIKTVLCAQVAVTEPPHHERSGERDPEG